MVGRRQEDRTLKIVFLLSALEDTCTAERDSQKTAYEEKPLNAVQVPWYIQSVQLMHILIMSRYRKEQ